MRKPGCLGDVVSRFLPQFVCPLPLLRAICGAACSYHRRCAPSDCAIVPCPEPEKACNQLPPRRSPLPPSATNTKSHPGISRRQAKGYGIKDRRRQAKEAQKQIRCCLPPQVPAEPRIYLAKYKFGPKQAPRPGKAARKAVEDRPLITIAHTAPSPTPARSCSIYR